MAQGRRCRKCARINELRRRKPTGLTKRQQQIIDAMAAGSQVYQTKYVHWVWIDHPNGVRDQTSRTAMQRLVELGLVMADAGKLGVSAVCEKSYSLTAAAGEHAARIGGDL